MNHAAEPFGKFYEGVNVWGVTAQPTMRAMERNGIGSHVGRCRAS